MSDQTDRAAEVIDTYLVGTSLQSQGKTIAEALEDERLLAAPVDGELREALVGVISAYMHGDYNVNVPLVDALLPIIAAHVAKEVPDG